MRHGRMTLLRCLMVFGLALAFSACERVVYDPRPYPDPVRGNLGGPCRRNGTCRPPMRCLEYYGIAGPSGPRFESCEIPCDVDRDCPRWARCVTIADGPGRVCRPVRD